VQKSKWKIKKKKFKKILTDILIFCLPDINNRKSKLTVSAALSGFIYLHCKTKKIRETKQQNKANQLKNAKRIKQ